MEYMELVSPRMGRGSYMLVTHLAVPSFHRAPSEAYFPVHLVVNFIAVGGPAALIVLGGLSIANSPITALLGLEVPSTKTSGKRGGRVGGWRASCGGFRESFGSWGGGLCGLYSKYIYIEYVEKVCSFPVQVVGQCGPGTLEGFNCYEQSKQSNLGFYCLT